MKYDWNPEKKRNPKSRTAKRFFRGNFRGDGKWENHQGLSASKPRKIPESIYRVGAFQGLCVASPVCNST